MEIHFCPRDNGACPLCRKLSSCAIRQALAGSVDTIADPRAHGMEIVIYACPQFVEKS
jgi:hypothetical protein